MVIIPFENQKECPVCGKIYSSDDNYCSEHSKLVELVYSNDLVKICPECGRKYPEDHNFCSKHSKLIIGIIAVIVVLAIVGAFATGMFNGHTSSPTATNDSSSHDNTSTQTVKPSIDNDSSSSAKTEYWASAKAEKFHTPDCEWAQKISDANLSWMWQEVSWRP